MDDSLFFDSDLSELTSDEDDYPPLAQTTRKAPVAKKAPAIKKDKKGYTIHGELRAPRMTQYAVNSIHDQLVDGAIDLDPPYQRDVVWPEAKQIGLIDSLIRNYYIPPVIFAVKTAEDGSETRVCIDGKQRLTSVQKFIDGLIPHRDSYVARRLVTSWLWLTS
ncbi:hypothetical protein OF83DRAFT_1085318 [Amylostereum chailletii]|nr:hypothetical protein OF83DRAFT_1085318 [Amylostereum chailletii]